MQLQGIEVARYPPLSSLARWVILASLRRFFSLSLNRGLPAALSVLEAKCRLRKSAKS
jgi:hypothetical protein